MTARIIRRGIGPEHWHVGLWRVALGIGALILAWAILASVAAAPRAGDAPQRRVAGTGDAPPTPVPLADFTPDRFLQTFFGKVGPEFKRAELLNKVEIAWNEEQQLGEQLWADAKQRLAAQKISLQERGRDVQYLQRLIEKIQPQMQQAQRYRKLEIAVAKLEVPNAMALPGGRIVVTKGMLDSASCEAALVCVLGHELAHLDRGHLLRRMKQWKLAQDQFSRLPTDFSVDKMFDKFSLIQQLFRQPFGPEEELEADQDGITWAYRLDYDPQTVQQVFLAMDRAGLGAPEFLPAFLRSHPLTADRLERLRTSCAALQAAESKDHLYAGRENLIRRTPRWQQEFPE